VVFVVVVLIVGSSIYIEVDTRKFIKNLPDAPDTVSSSSPRDIVKETPDTVSSVQDSGHQGHMHEEAFGTQEDSLEPSDWKFLEDLNAQTVLVEDASHKSTGADVDVDETFDWSQVSVEGHVQHEVDVLFEKYGDIPQIQTYREYMPRLLRREPMKISEHVELIRAMAYLYPTPKWKKSLEQIETQLELWSTPH
jgi:hypothetical protein